MMFSAKCNQVAWLVTIGEFDASFMNTLEFLDQLREEIAGDSRIFLPSEEIARLWGKEESE